MAESKSIRDYGSWDSVISSSTLVEGQVNLSELQTGSNTLYWLENRATEKGRVVIVRLKDGEKTDLLKPPYSAKSRVHEYGGGAYCVDNRVDEADLVYFVNASDQQIYCVTADGSIKPITQLKQHRFADLQVSPCRRYLVCVCEWHKPGESEPLNLLASIDVDDGSLKVLAQGNDFYAYPRFSISGKQLAWISWDHPNLPWDNTRLYSADFTQGEAQNAHLAIEPQQEAIFQPQWNGEELYYVSDRNNWWTIYSARQPDTALCDTRSEFGLPLWVFALSTYQFIDSQTIIATYRDNGQGHLCQIDLAQKTLSSIQSDYTEFDYLCSGHGKIFFVGSSPVHYPAVVELDPNSGQQRVVHSSSSLQLDPAWIAIPEAITFNSSDNQQAHGFYYPPTNPDFIAPADTLPPLLVMLHGGPTSYTSSRISLKIQFWTSRGFAVLDLNYRGSTGYGRDYRQQLYARWGQADVDDCILGARAIADRGKADPAKMFIRGGSAGGYTTLCALTFHDTFVAGASYYGVSDLNSLLQDTHKFEARYLDQLIGPVATAQQEYHDRSPINSVDQLNCPVIFFQGLQDKVVPPNQSECLVNALRKKSVPVCYVTYEEEQHGFRQAENIQHSLDSELYFYTQVMGLAANNTTGLEIENVANLSQTPQS